MLKAAAYIGPVPTWKGPYESAARDSTNATLITELQLSSSYDRASTCLHDVGHTWIFLVSPPPLEGCSGKSRSLLHRMRRHGAWSLSSRSFSKRSCAKRWACRTALAQTSHSSALRPQQIRLTDGRLNIAAFLHSGALFSLILTVTRVMTKIYNDGFTISQV